MINPKNFIYSISSVARMLGIPLRMVKRVEKWANCVFVIVAGRRPRFWKKSAFTNHFVEWRKKAAEELETKRLDLYSFQVKNSAKNTVYYPSAKPTTIECNCEDYHNQIRHIGKGCCKHGYAVLSFLGFDRLSDYIKQYEWLGDNYYEEIDYDEAREYIFGATHW
jgi:hypothetical protein